MGKTMGHIVQKRNKSQMKLVCPGFIFVGKTLVSCPFYINARGEDDFTVHITTLNLTHNCSCEGRVRQIKTSIVKDFAPISTSSFSPSTVKRGGDSKQLTEMIEKESGLKVRYGQAHEIVSTIRGISSVQVVGQFRLLESYFALLQENDVEGTYSIATKAMWNRPGEKEFISYYCAPSCTKQFWKESRRCVYIDGTHIYNEVGGVLLFLVTKDANNSLIVLAFGYCRKEDRDNYDMFFERARVDFPGKIVAIGDGDKGMEFSLLAIWKDVELSRCLRHRMENYQSKHPGHRIRREEVRPKIYGAVRSTNPSTWKFLLSELLKLQHGQEIVNWLNDIRTSCHAHFYNDLGHARFGDTLNNPAEQMNNAVKDSRFLPVVEMTKALLQWIFNKFFEAKMDIRKIEEQVGVVDSFTNHGRTTIKSQLGKAQQARYDHNNYICYQDENNYDKFNLSYFRQ
tara:strand:- start:1062 stop:2426 length:1365 start_codon:yes stop_codon:yes gene_type:complete